MNIGLVNVVSQKDENNTEKDLSEKQKMILDNLYRCRDLEINNLWQKGIFLGPFLVLCFTGYSFLLHELFKERPFSIGINILCMVLCVISAIFSMLWIYMFKGSKAQYELCERAITNYEQRNLNIPYGYAMGTLRHNEIEFDNDLLNTKAGKFSPSKVNIVIGQVSLIAWLAAIIFHIGYLFSEILVRNYGEYNKFVKFEDITTYYIITLFLLLLLGTSYLLYRFFYLKEIQSSYLSPSNRERYIREILNIVSKERYKKIVKGEDRDRKKIEKIINSNIDILDCLQEIYGIDGKVTSLFTEKEIIYLDACRYLVELGEVNISEENIVKNKSEESIMEKNLSTLASSLGIKKEQVEKLNNYIREKYQR